MLRIVEFLVLGVLQQGTARVPAAAEIAPHLEEVRIDSLHIAFSRAAVRADAAFVHANVVDVRGGRVLPDQTVIVRDGRIERVGPSANTAVPAGMRRIDASGKWLSPGLTDMHVHTTGSSSLFLLSLAAGVTTMREMAGDDWMLPARARLQRGELAGPRMFLTAKMLNGAPLGMYATPVRTEAEVRDEVRREKRLGYDFVKVWNNLPLALYRAAMDEAAKVGIPLDGHIPHEARVADAIAGGHRTLEHYKAFYLDATLTLSSEDYVSLLKEHAAWLTPTFSVYHRQSWGPDSSEVFYRRPELRYVPPRDVREWRSGAAERPSSGAAKTAALTRTIFRQLRGTRARYLAGTDGGADTGYTHSVPGFVLIHELEIMEGLGMSPAEALATATVNAAEVMAPGTFGEIVPGASADLLLLDANPLETVRNLHRRNGVMARGFWFDGATLDRMLEGIAAIYREGDAVQPNVADLVALAQRYSLLRQAGAFMGPYEVTAIAQMLRRAGHGEIAQAFEQG